VLPRCCPHLRVLRLQQLRRLKADFLSALQQLEVCNTEHARRISMLLQPDVIRLQNKLQQQAQNPSE
jgi:hypothetical protein